MCCIERGINNRKGLERDSWREEIIVIAADEQEKKKKKNSFFFNDTATTEIYTLSLHDALPISYPGLRSHPGSAAIGSDN